MGSPATRIAVRVPVQRMVWNSDDELPVAESRVDVQLYRQFFGKLSQTVFLKAHEM